MYSEEIYYYQQSFIYKDAYTPVIGLSTVSFPGLQQKIVKINFSDMHPQGAHKQRVLTAIRGKKHGSI